MKLPFPILLLIAYVDAFLILAFTWILYNVDALNAFLLRAIS